MIKKSWYEFGVFIYILILSACTSVATKEASEATKIFEAPESNTQVDSAASFSDQSNHSFETDKFDVSPEKSEPAVSIYPGTGNFIDIQAAKETPASPLKSGDITLNFEGAGIREVVKVIFDILQENYVIDSAVQGEITIQTGSPLTRDMLIPTLEILLRMNNAALVQVDGLYKVTPLARALPGNVAPRLSDKTQKSGYGVRIVPLQYISALEMQKILAPLIPEGSVLQVDSTRNLLMLAGTPRELAIIQETIDIFDVNWLKGMSVAIYRLRNVDSQTVAAEMDKLFGQSSQLPLAGMFHFVPVDQLNAVLVISPQKEYLDEAGLWIERLDGSGGEQLYVYPMQNGRADYVASLLNEVFGGATAPKTASPQVAPGLQPASLSTSVEGGAPSLSTPSRSTPSGSVSASEVDIGTEQVRIIADTENNSLLIWASQRNYEKMLSALRKIDVSPRQVLVEATIAEVTLTGELRYGLQWFFKNNDIDGSYQGTGSLDLNTNVRLNNVLGNGFSYVLSDSDGIVRALLNMLASESRLKVLSSPQVMVIDNQEAEIRVGSQQPVLTSTTVTEGGNTIESIQFKDTGVILTVRPQINAGGLVTMDLRQEVTDVGPVDEASTGQRTFDQRIISSRVAIQSGKTIILGGLIRDREDSNKNGVPGLYKLPLIGPLFGSTQDISRRTELVVLITPKVIQDSLDAAGVTEELKRKMQELAPLVDSLNG